MTELTFNEFHVFEMGILSSFTSYFLCFFISVTAAVIA